MHGILAHMLYFATSDTCMVF